MTKAQAARSNSDAVHDGYLVLLAIPPTPRSKLFPYTTSSDLVGSLSKLPGTLPAFLAVVLPCLGWHGIVSLMSEVPAPLIHTVVALALVGALYEAVRVSVQFHLTRMIASITTILFSLVWWHVGATGKAAPDAGWYLSTVSVAGSARW